MANSIFYRIVVPTDFSTCSEEAWRLARRVATEAGGELILTHALSEAPLYGEGLTTDVRPVYEEARKWAEAALEAWVAEARAARLSARTALRTGVAHRTSGLAWHEPRAVLRGCEAGRLRGANDRIR